MIKIKSKDEINKMVRAAEIVRDLLFELENIIKPGISTLELDSFSENFITTGIFIPVTCLRTDLLTLINIISVKKQYYDFF